MINQCVPCGRKSLSGIGGYPWTCVNGHTLHEPLPLPGPFYFVAPPTQPDRPESRMSDERLEEIEREYTESPCRDSLLACWHHTEVFELLTEVRRLRRALSLSEASRSVPTVGNRG